MGSNMATSLLLAPDALKGLLVRLHIQEAAGLGVALDVVARRSERLAALAHCTDSMPVPGRTVLGHGE